MGVWTGLAVYVVIWWMVIFAVLPWGVRGVEQADVAKGHASGAPQKPKIFLKMAVTTVLATIIWAGVYLLAESGWVSLRQ